MVVADFSGKNIFLDTAPLIYFIEESPTFLPVLTRFFEAHTQGAFVITTSVITLTEVLVKPLREGLTDLADRYRTILTATPGVWLQPVDDDIAVEAAKLRARYGLRTPDAIQLATALFVEADYFFTNDLRLKTVSETTVVTLSELL